MEIRREAIIEIVGTQYEGRAVNHQGLSEQDEIVLKRQSDNPHDENAILVFSSDGKELGYIPKGYASLYAPAMDSGKYNFSVKIIKTSYDPERPILIIKVTSEPKNLSEDKVEDDVIDLVQHILNIYNKSKDEYLGFVYSDTVDIDNLVNSLNNTRLYHKLYTLSGTVIDEQDKKTFTDTETVIDHEQLEQCISELSSDVGNVLMKIQKDYNDSLDIDDEDEFQRVQSEIREKRKHFRAYQSLLSSYTDVIRNFTKVSSDLKPVEETKDAGDFNVNTEQTEDITSEPEIEETPEYTEEAFFNWLVTDGNIADDTARQYISNIHSIEKLYQTIIGYRENLIGIDTADRAKAIIEDLIYKPEYIDANERRKNSFGNALAEFSQFVGITVSGLSDPPKKKDYQSIDNTAPYVVKNVDFDDPHSCTYYKPCTLILNGERYMVGTWRELYEKVLILLYSDSKYTVIMRGLIGFSLYGRRIDFADNTLVSQMRVPLRISTNFYAEGNLSAVDIIKHIKCLMKVCLIDSDHLTIEYNTQERASADEIETEPIPTDSEKLSESISGENDGASDDMISSETIVSTPYPIASDDHTIGSVNVHEEISANADLEPLDEARAEIKDRDDEFFNIPEGKSFISLWDYINTRFRIEPIPQEKKSGSGYDQRNIHGENNICYKYYKDSRLLGNLYYKNGRYVRYVKFEVLDSVLSAEHIKQIVDINIFDDFKEREVNLNKFIFTYYDKVNGAIKSICDAIDEHFRTVVQYETTNSENDEIRIEPQENIAEPSEKVISTFAPDKAKLFVLKDALIEIFSSDADEIKALYEYNNGLSSKALKDIIRKYYDRNVSQFEISTLLMLDKAFKPVGKGCYILKPEMMLTEPSTHSIDSPNDRMTEDIATVSDSVSIDKDIDVSQRTASDSISESLIIELMKENADNLQYADGFGTYEIKQLLYANGHDNVLEADIAEIMASSDELEEIEKGYYIIAEKDQITENDTPVEIEEPVIEQAPEIHAAAETAETLEISSENEQRRIIIKIDGMITRAFDCDDALSKVCEFAIIYSPFKMARIAGQNVRLNDSNVFYRRSVPTNGYNKLSNGLQIISVNSVKDLRAITEMVKNYCEIGDDLISIISE